MKGVQDQLRKLQERFNDQMEANPDAVIGPLVIGSAVAVMFAFARGRTQSRHHLQMALQSAGYRAAHQKHPEVLVRDPMAEQMAGTYR